MKKIITVRFEGEGTENCYDLKQWNYGITLRIEGLSLPEKVEVHFALDNSEMAQVYLGTTEDGVTTVKVPAFILENADGIACVSGGKYKAFAYIYQSDEESGWTVRKIIFHIEARQRPEDYVHTEEDLKTWEKLENRIGEVDKKKLTAPQTAKVGQIFHVQEVNEDGTLTLEAVDLPKIPEVPTKVSDLENDKGFVTNIVNDLVNYYLKSEVYTKQEVQSLVGIISSFKLIKVDALPTEDIKTNAIYLILKEQSEESNIYTEYIYMDGKWETIGDTSVDLSQYALNKDVNELKSDIGELQRTLETEKTDREQADISLQKDISGKLSEPVEGLDVGKYFRVAQIDENGHAVLEAVDLPIASGTQFGVVRVQSVGTERGIYISSEGFLSTQLASTSQIDKRTNFNNSITPYNLDYAVKAAMCDGKGAAWTADEQAAARERMGCYNGYTVLMDAVIEEEANMIYFTLPNNTVEFIAYFDFYDTEVVTNAAPYLLFDNKGNVNPIKSIYSYFGTELKVGDTNIKGIQKCVILNDEDVCVEYSALSRNNESSNQSQNRVGRVAIAKRTSNRICFFVTAGSYPIGTRFLVLVRCQ